jgi:NAD(P)-dependent dehydrogenase (short-subunit alcohol dehydrogenase family)
MFGGRDTLRMSPLTELPGPDLSGQVALITGGGRGIGRACAVALAAAGAAVAVVARTASELDETVATARAAGGTALPFRADVRDRDAMRDVTDGVRRQLGPVDLLVNNAGTAAPIGPLTEVEPEDWWQGLEVNLRGPMLCCRLVLPDMIARRRGRIVNVASGAGTVAIPYLSAYVVSKAALIRLSECLAAECHPYGVSVFAIQPGTVRTAMAEEALTGEAGRRWMPWFREYFEQGRDVPPETAARLVLFLAAGQGDALSGRFLDACADYAGLVGQADRIQKEELLVLRLRGTG